MPRDHAGWARSTSAEQELGCGVYDTVGFETAKLQCHQPCPPHAWGQHRFPAAEALLTGLLLSTQHCWGRQGKEAIAVTTRVLGRTVAWQEGGGSCQEDKDKAAATLEQKDAEQHQEPA